MAYKHDVFLSYTGLESQFAERIHGDLTRFGVSVWFDKTDMPDDHSGDANEIRYILKRVMHDSRVLLLLISSRSIASRWVRYEMDTLIDLEAKDRHKKIILILIGQGSERDIPAAISDRPTHDLRNNFDARYRKYRKDIFRDVAPNFDRLKYRELFED